MWTSKKENHRPRRVFYPLPDITAYELALILKALDWAKSRDYEQVEEYFHALPDSVKRHFQMENKS